MQKYFLHLGLLLIVAAFFALASCSDKSSGGNGVGVEDNGLTSDINDFVPDSLIEIIEALGMPVNRGDSPPILQGYYLCSPFILINSNRPSDIIGRQYSDYYMRFYNQNTRKLTISLDYQNYPEEGEGLGSYIVGENGNFSVFSRLTSYYLSDSAYVLLLLSGRKIANGIENLHIAAFMLDNFENPSGYFINNNDGRVFYESDSLAEEVNEFPKKAVLDDIILRSMITISEN
jgi:hypothetical protein